MLALKRLVVDCNYGEHLNQVLWERFVCELNNLKIRNSIEHRRLSVQKGMQHC